MKLSREQALVNAMDFIAADALSAVHQRRLADAQQRLNETRSMLDTVQRNYEAMSRAMQVKQHEILRVRAVAAVVVW